MTANYRRASGAVAAAALVAVIGGPSVTLGQEKLCDDRLAVELDPGVPNVSNEGFLSSLLNRHFNYHLELLRQNDRDASIIEVELTGPGPEGRCQDVIETMRRDARVESIRVESVGLAFLTRARDET